MPHQIKGKSSFVPNILAIHLEIVKIVPKSEQHPDVCYLGKRHSGLKF